MRRDEAILAGRLAYEVTHARLWPESVDVPYERLCGQMLREAARAGRVIVFPALRIHTEASATCRGIRKIHLRALTVPQ